MNDVEAQADRVAAALVAEHLGGSVRSDVYALTVAVVAKAYLLGQLEAREDFAAKIAFPTKISYRGDAA